MKIIRENIAILGCGHLGTAIANGLTGSKLLKPGNITLTRRDVEHLSHFKERGFKTTSDNKAAVNSAMIIILAVTPQQVNEILAEIKGVLSSQRHTILSVVSGVSVRQIKQQLGAPVPVVRVMPNTAIAIRDSMTCICADDVDKDSLIHAVRIFDCLGKTKIIHEDLMVPATALCACGTAFFLRAIRAASQGGIEIGFHAEDALFMAAQTAKGAAALLVEQENGNHPEQELDKVTTPQGCTISGLNQMEHHGFSSSMIKGIVTSAEKAANLYTKN